MFYDYSASRAPSFCMAPAIAHPTHLRVSVLVATANIAAKHNNSQLLDSRESNLKVIGIQYK